MISKYKIIKYICMGCGKKIVRRSYKKLKYCSLPCYRKSIHPNRRTGKIIACCYCGKKIYKFKTFLSKNKHSFCSIDCANKYQSRNKIKIICKICRKSFKISKSYIKQNRTYCSWKCRLKDKEHIHNSSMKANISQQNKKGLNKLELSGRKIMEDMGVAFQEQVPMFNKFLVDVLIPKYNIIIQWDGVYWHSKPKRMKLDESQDLYLKKCGYKIIRITDSEIKNNIKNVYTKIRHAIYPHI